MSHALLLLIHTSHTYILLTANLDDIEALAKELANSPVAEQFKNIWRRASKQLQGAARPNYKGHQASDFINRATETSHEVSTPPQDPPTRSDVQVSPVENQVVDDIINLGMTASYYLNSMKQIILNEKDPPPRKTVE